MRSVTYVDCRCAICGKHFERPIGYQRQTCSDECKIKLNAKRHVDIRAAKKWGKYGKVGQSSD